MLGMNWGHIFGCWWLPQMWYTASIYNTRSWPFRLSLLCNAVGNDESAKCFMPISWINIIQGVVCLKNFRQSHVRWSFSFCNALLCQIYLHWRDPWCQGWPNWKCAWLTYQHFVSDQSQILPALCSLCTYKLELIFSWIEMHTWSIFLTMSRIPCNSW